MKPNFSLIHATYGRPEKAVAAMRAAIAQASNPKAIEYIFACNADDPTLPGLLAELKKPRPPSGVNFTLTQGNFAGSAPAWDAGAKESSGEVLIQMSDDLELPGKFDTLLTKECEFNAGAKWNDRPAYIAVSDGFRKDSLCTCAVMNRKYYELAGHFIPPEYRSVHSDGEVTFRAKQRSRSGDATWIDAKNIVFLHRHHYNDPSVPWDHVYARGNSPEAYDTGLALLLERNPGISGQVDWL